MATLLPQEYGLNPRAHRHSSTAELSAPALATALAPELRLLLACSGLFVCGAGVELVRGVLGEEIDWTRFAHLAREHGLAPVAGLTLSRVAPDLVPDDILDALGAVVEGTRRTNLARFEELALVLDALSGAGVEAIPLKGPVLAIQAYGDLGLRVFRDLDVLLRDNDLDVAIDVLRRLGYERKDQLTKAQFDLIHRLRGQDILFKEPDGTVIEPHTRLTGVQMALDVDYTGLWGRSQRAALNGRSMLLLAPEDEFTVLAIHGGKELWWNMKWVCDVAAFIAAHPRLDWPALMDRARAQGCLRMVLLATALARGYFGAAVPEVVIAAEHADPAIAPMVVRIVATQWQADVASSSPSYSTLSADRLRLHDGTARRARYIARTLFLPQWYHVAATPLPRQLSFAYVPLKLAHDLVALPLWRAYRRFVAQAERWHGALGGHELALAMTPLSPETRLNIKQHHKIRVAAEKATAANPNNAAAWRNLGDALSALNQHKKAIACYDKALAIAPYNTVVWKDRAAALRAAGERLETPESGAQDAETWVIRAGQLLSTKRFAEALAASDRALAIDPKNVRAAAISIRTRLFACDWRKRVDDRKQIAEGIRTGRNVISPFFLKAMSDSEAEHLSRARDFAKSFLKSPKSLWRPDHYQHDRIRIAYQSTDFRDHVVSDVIAGCLERHDHSRFETTAISLGPNDKSGMRRRLEATFDRFVDGYAMSDADVAAVMRELEIDIAVDLNGNSGEFRAKILARRPAPVQVNYLGYPGTTAMPFIDYIIADRTIIPDENCAYYAEQVVHLPHSYLPTDRTRPIAESTPSRTKAGLPANGFVFACHNHEHKIGPEIFDIWMRLLQEIDGSVLWLKSLNPLAVSNLRREARARGVAPDRLIFASHLPRTEDHLARLRLADLFLDTLPYNAHATACDALWVGLPVVTCLGKSFAGRVGAGLLRAIDLPELIAESLSDYEMLALTLARDPERLAGIKAKLLRNRETEPLFDTARFTRNLERAYTIMWERQQAGLPPKGFVVQEGRPGS